MRLFRRRKPTIRQRLHEAHTTLTDVRDNMQWRIEAGDLDLDDIVYRARDAATDAIRNIEAITDLLFGQTPEETPHAR